MFGQPHYYHRIIRKMVVAFGTMFNEITLKRYNKAGTQEIERINVPLMYSQKEKFYQRIKQDPELTKETSITLPRMSFEMTSITYDPTRKRGLYADSYSPGSSRLINAVRSTPYNFDFALSIYVRNVEDGTQIIEQILPYFNPDFTLNIDLIGLQDQKIDVPFVLQSVIQDVEDVGSADPTRVIIWTLTFTAKGYLFGPILSANVIRQVTANVYTTTVTSIPSSGAPLVLNIGENEKGIVLSNTGGLGTYKTGELVYEGRTLQGANATAFVTGWDTQSNILFVHNVNGILKENKTLFGAESNAAYTMLSFSTRDTQLTHVVITSDPSTANANTAFGYDTQTSEFPNIV